MPTDDDILSGDDFGTAGSSGAASDDDTREQTLVTKEGLARLKEELDHLKSVRRKEVAQRLKEAISYGDLSENSEYEEAKNEQAFVEGRIIDLERKIKSARIISEKESKAKVKEVTIGSRVTLLNVTEKDGVQEAYVIVGATEADPFAQRISNESPIGRALLGRVKGDRVSVHTPSGAHEFEIVKVA